jgi:hypothetical protein
MNVAAVENVGMNLCINLESFVILSASVARRTYAVVSGGSAS